MTDNKLKPCPFCGGEAEVDKTNRFGYYVQCLKCKLHEGYWFEKEYAVDWWNKRA